METGKEQIERIKVILAALGVITTQKGYYKTISHLEDVPHNMEQLFNELETIYNMFNEELEDIQDR